MRDVVLRAVPRKSGPLDVADLGCGAGTQSFVWAQLGHRLHGLDISAKFIQLGMKRASQAGLQVDFRVGSVTDLPWPDESLDICLSIELLEHVADWRRCLDEFTRALRRGSALFLTTTNTLCPKQQEFDLPIYSWYPAWVKRHYERLAQTTRPELVTYATYPDANVQARARLSKPQADAQVLASAVIVYSAHMDALPTLLTQLPTPPS